MVNRYSKLELKNGRFLKNRVIIPPMASQTAARNGYVTKATEDHYARLANANVAMIFVEYTYVHLTGRSEHHQLSVSSDQYIEGLGKIAAIIKKSGAMAALQLTHAGSKTSKELTNGQLLGPSPIAVPTKVDLRELPTQMTVSEIENLKHWFVNAAGRGIKAGFDLIEIHSAHGYGLNQWLSPVTNQRRDLYGRNLKGRSKLLLNIVQELKKRHPNTLLSVRIPGQDHFADGLKTSDMKLVAKDLEKLGVDIINVSSGIGGWKRPDHRHGEGYLVSDAKLIQEVVSIPVIGVGGIKTGKYIDQALQKNYFALAAVGRAILFDDQWTNYFMSQKIFKTCSTLLVK